MSQKRQASPPQSRTTAPAQPHAVVPLEINPSKSDELPDLDLPGCLPHDQPMAIRRKAAEPAQTEHLLNALIGECHFLMREVAFRCIVQSPIVEDRLSFMRSAMSFAETGAKVGKAVAKLRHAPLNEEAVIAKAIAAADRRREEKTANPSNNDQDVAS